MRPLPRGRAITLVAGLASLLIAATTPTPASAFPLAGCQLSVVSIDATGQAIDTADGAGDAGSQQDPLRVAWDGTVAWQGGTGTQTIRDTSWHVDLFGLPTLLRGGDPNPEGDRTGSDSIRIAEAMPFRFTGLYQLSGRFEGNGGSCTASGWVMVLGDPATTLPFAIGLGLVLIGAVLLAVGVRGSWWAAIGGGLLLGIGGCLMLVIHAALPLGAATLLLALGMGLLAGLLAGWAGTRRARPTESPGAA